MNTTLILQILAITLISILSLKFSHHTSFFKKHPSILFSLKHLSIGIILTASLVSLLPEANFNYQFSLTLSKEISRISSDSESSLTSELINQFETFSTNLICVVFFCVILFIKNVLFQKNIDSFNSIRNQDPNVNICLLHQKGCFETEDLFKDDQKNSEFIDSSKNMNNYIELMDLNESLLDSKKIYQEKNNELWTQIIDLENKNPKGKYIFFQLNYPKYLL